MKFEDHRGLLRCAIGALPLFTLCACRGDESIVPINNPQPLNGESRVSTDPPGSSYKEDTRISHAGNNVYVVWTDERTGEYRLRFTASFDGGATWPVADVELPAQPGSFGASDPWIDSDGLTVHVTYEDDGASADEIYYLRSTDGGATWSTPVRLNHGPLDAVDVDHPHLVSVANHVYVVWEDERADFFSNDVYINISDDGGLTWLATDVRLDDGPPGTDAEDPEICADGSFVYVAWNDTRSSVSEIYFSGSTDFGGSFSDEVRLTTNVTEGGAGSADEQRIDCSGSNVYVVWIDERIDSGDIYMSASADAGATWPVSELQVDHAPFGARTEHPDVACYGTTVHVVWEDERNDLVGSDDDIYYNTSNDGGATWLAADLRLDTDPQTNDSDEPFVEAHANGVVAVVWDDDRNGSSMRMNYSTDGGLSFQSSDVQLDGAPAGFSDADYPFLSLDNNGVQVSWVDERTGIESDIYVNSVTMTVQPQ